ncbi:alkaline phosphatase [Streptomyces sp. ACA25]|uniref:alkaline phosphatase n=1 Tax=Streptomyces sp. ACA25 TaxID=3022596 RepID=UPI0023079BE7|nr:alkaline phosphatase [Streptomyces sp. ACA25]MDB1086142.1 alkaline phosphatase [Streptomyces sp. ACA25]
MSSERQRNGQDGGRTGGLTRRSLFKMSGTGVAGVAIAGLGAGAVAASGGPGSGAGPAGPVAAAAPGPLAGHGPHAFTRRSTPWIRGRAEPRLRIVPLDRATFLAGARFDLRVEAAGVDPGTARMEISVEGPEGPAPVIMGEPERSSPAPGVLAVTYRDLWYPYAGEFTVRAGVLSVTGSTDTTVTHQVITAEAGGRRAKNIIFFLGDGMGAAAVTGARLLSRGMTEGKYHGLLEMDRMQYRGMVGTSGADSIATDSANSMSAYMCGHKASVNSMGVYDSSEPEPDRHPWVETMAELLKRARGMRVGVVTTAEIQDATPAAVFAHTQDREQYATIMDQALGEERRPDVLLGGGLATMLPRSAEGSARDDDRDLVAEFEELGYRHVSTAKELEQAVSGTSAPERLLGLFHTGNLDVYLDRQQIRDPDVLGEWDDQPTLMQMTQAALHCLQGSENGFFLMVEGASIDKMQHPLDGTRALYDTIEFDRAIGVARQWAEGRDDTLIVATADHSHSMSIVGTHDRRAAAGRQANGVYGDAGFPTYADADGDGFPDDPDPDVQLFFGWASHPDHTDGFRHQEVLRQPALLDEDTGRAVANPGRDPHAELRTGNLPHPETHCVHTVEDVPVFASGPGAERVNGFLDNTELFFVLMHALQLDPLREG